MPGVEIKKFIFLNFGKEKVLENNDMNLIDYRYLNKNDKYKIHQIYNGFSRNSLTLALFSWHLKSKLPFFLGGFEADSSNKKYRRKRV